MQPARAQQNGFTIIELMMVLAAGGILFLIVLQAIPALVRNGNNNARKQDVAAILSSISHYQLSHSGSFPPSADPDWQQQLTQFTKLTHYDTADIHTNPGSSGGSVITTVPDTEVQVRNYYICDNENHQAVSQGAGYRSIVALYTIETSGGTALKCQSL